MKTNLTVYFEDPFWVGVFERIDEGKYSVCKVTFGAEPTDNEVWAFVENITAIWCSAPPLQPKSGRRRIIQNAGSARQKSYCQIPVSEQKRSRRFKNSGKP